MVVSVIINIIINNNNKKHIVWVSCSDFIWSVAFSRRHIIIRNCLLLVDEETNYGKLRLLISFLYNSGKFFP